jgi:endonuclease/exonuclease/phosphatase (EEP) superfamily protein YafD
MSREERLQPVERAMKELEATFPAMRGPATARPMRWLARCVVALVVAGAIACTAGYALGPEHFGLMAQAQYLPYPLYLLPALAAVAISLKLGRAWRAMSALSLALVATTVMGLEFHTGDAGTGSMRVMTYNVKGYLALGQSDGIALIAREIALHQPDLLVLQDARELTEAEEKSPGIFRAIFGDQHAYAYREYVVVSRYPLRSCKHHDMAFRERPQAYVQCIVDVRGVEIDVITAHFMSPRYALGAVREGSVRAIDEWRENLAARMSHAEALAIEVRATWRPVVLAGDLNAPERSLVVRTLLDTGLRDAFSTAGKGYGYTWGHSLRPGLSFLRIDHILVSPEIGVADCFVGGAQASPHRPVIADLYLSRRPR